MENGNLRMGGSGINYQGRIYTCGKSFAGQAHTVTTDELIEKVSPFFKRMGLVRFADITGYDRIGIPVVNAVRPFERGMSVSHGKGVDLAAAMASALMESVERFCAVTTELPCVRDSYVLLKKKNNVVPAELLPLSKHSIFNPDNQELWTTGWDIVSGQEVMLPYSLVTMNWSDSELDSFFKSSNGLAGSVDFLEAVTQALIEVIERDATTNSLLEARCRKSSTLLRRVRPETIAFDRVNGLTAKIEEVDVYWVIYDCTIDTAVPTYECQLIDLREPDFLLCKGMGASLDVETAMTRAVTEAVQARAVVLSGVREAFFASEILPLRLAGKENLLQILNDEQSKDWEWVDADRHRSIITTAFEEDIAVCVERLQAVGFHQVIVVDLSPEDYDFHVVRVVVPGLEGVADLMNYAPGRRANAFLRGKRV